MPDVKNVRIVVVGAVNSTLRILEGLHRNNANVVGAMGLATSHSKMVSGYTWLEPFCERTGIPFQSFENINSKDSVSVLRSWQPDLLFTVGFSQLVGQDILDIPTRATVGFHPSHLPRGRGRAPLAWITYNCEQGAANFFIITDGVDDGPILAQELFSVDPDDHAGDVETKLLNAIDRALDQWIPKLLQGEWKPQIQDESKATYTGIRRPLDGLIDWHEPFQTTYARIRAASHPHPGAYTFVQGREMIIWRSKPGFEARYSGVPGRVLLVDQERGFLVQSGDGQLWLTECEYADSPLEVPQLRAGDMLGSHPQNEIYKLYQRIEKLEEELQLLKEKA